MKGLAAQWCMLEYLRFSICCSVMRRAIGILSRATLRRVSREDTVVRELKEETGIADARFIDGFREEISYFYKRQGASVYKQVIFYLIEAAAPKVTLSFEHTGFEWLPYEKALEKLTFRNAKNVLKKANEYLKTRGIG